MKKHNLIFVLIFIFGISALASAISVQVTSPTSGSTVSSPVIIKAQASSSSPINQWWISVDGVSAWHANTSASSISQSIAVAAGTHTAKVRAWDTTGATYVTSVTFTVGSSTSTVSVAVSPSNAVLQTGATTQFSAAVTGSTNTAVTWLVNGVVGGSSTTGTVSTTGLYKAPAAVPSTPSVTVTAKSVADTTKSANATVSISSAPSAVKVAISPTSATVQTSQTKQFTAAVTGTTNTAVTWQVAGVTGGNSSVGLISSTGVYTAPLQAPSPNPVSVTARSAYDSTATSSAAVTVTGGTTTGKNYYVSTTGSDSNDGSATRPWKTIQHAASLVTAGYTVHVAPGTYTTSSNFKSTASGTASARIVYISDSQWGAKLVSTASGAGTITFWNTGSYVDIKGFDVTGSGSAGIFNGGSYVRIIGNHVHDMRVAGCLAGAGILNYYSGHDNDVIGNMVHDIGDFSISCNQTHGIYQSNPGGKIYNNIAYHNRGWGIHTWHFSTNVTISNNTIFNNGQGGIIIGAGDGSGATNDNSIISNNVVYKNGLISGAAGYGIEEYGTTGTHNQYLNNLVYQNGPANWRLQNGNTNSGTLTVDPQFVNYTGTGTGDYHLKSTSPAINSGTSTGAPANAYDGGQRPMGGSWDRGAYEMGATPSSWPY